MDAALRSAPVRSGASQFALRASAAVSHDTEIPYRMTYQARDVSVRPRPLAQVLRNSPPGIRRRQPRHRDTIPNYISSQRREGPSTPTHQVPSNSLSGHLFAVQPRNGDTIPNDISRQRRESTSGHRVSAYSMMLQLYVRQPGG